MTSGRLANIASYEDVEFNNNVTEDREDRRKKEVEDLISKYAKKKDKDEVSIRQTLLGKISISVVFPAAQEWK